MEEEGLERNEAESFVQKSQKLITHTHKKLKNYRPSHSLILPFHRNHRGGNGDMGATSSPPTSMILHSNGQRCEPF